MLSVSDDSLFLYLFFYHIAEVVYRHSADIATLAATDRNIFRFNLLIADNQHIRNFLKLCFTDLKAYLLASVVNINSDTAIFKLSGKL